MAEDTDVPGSIAPQDRADHGPWLTDPAKLARYHPADGWSLNLTRPDARLKRVELKGWVTYNDEIARDDEGLSVMRPPIIDAIR